MRRCSEIIVLTFLSFGISLFSGVLLFLFQGIVKEFGQSSDKLTSLLMFIPAACFITGAALIIFGIPGFISSILCGIFISTKLGKQLELATFGTGLIGFLTFKAYANFGSLFSVQVHNAFLLQFVFKIAMFGFGVSGFVLSILIQTLLKNPDSKFTIQKQPQFKVRVAMISFVLVGYLIYSAII